MRWLWRGINLLLLGGVVAVHAVFLRIVFDGGELYPRAIALGAVVATAFLYTTLFNLHRDFLRFPRPFIGLETVIELHHYKILIGWLSLLVLGLIV